MKRIYLFLTAALAIMLAPSCEQMPQEGLPVAGTKEIKLSAGLGAYTKATDTAFENGDAIGLNIIVEQPYLENAKFTMTGGALTPDEAYFWYDDSSLKSTVFAYYPYSKDFKYDYSDFEFTVNADQSTHKYYTQSDLMMAKVEGVTPTEETVYLPFNHMLSKVVISIENNLGEGIDAVYFSNVYGSVNIDPVTMDQTVTGSKGTIKSARAYDEKGNEVWTLILAPQAEALPELIVTTASQKQMTFTLSNPVTFSAGRQSTANVVLDAETLQTDFTPVITDWLPDNELNFGQEGDDEDDVVVPEPKPEVSIWGVVGTITDWGGEPDVAMVYDEKYNMFRSDTLYFTPADAFKIRANNEWVDTANYGIEDGLTAKTFINVAIPVFTSGYSADIKPGVYGVYSVWFDLENSFVYVLEEGVTPDMAGDITLEDQPVEVEHTWGLIGSFNGWAEDYPTTIVDGVAVAEGVTLEAGAEFKFRADGAWGIDYGTGAVHESGVAMKAVMGGANCSVAVAGVYDVYFNIETYEITVVLGDSLQETDKYIVVDVDEVAFTSDGAQIEFKLGANFDWAVRHNSDWLAVSPESGCISDADSTWLVSVFVQDNVSYYSRSDTLKFYNDYASAYVVIIQHGIEQPAGPVEATVSEFLAAAESSDVWYQLTGTITSIANDTYGNFTIEDETGSVYVYGLTATQVSSNDKSFSTLGLGVNDVVTLIGTRAAYNSTPQVGGPAYYVSHVDNPDPVGPALPDGVESIEVDFSTVTGSTQYAEESHTFGALTLNIVACHINSQLRIYSSSSNNGIVTSNELPGNIYSIDMTAGNKADNLIVYGSNDGGATWTEVQKVATAAAYADYTVSFDGLNYNMFKLDVEGTQQVRISKMTVNYYAATK